MSFKLKNPLKSPLKQNHDETVILTPHEQKFVRDPNVINELVRSPDTRVDFSKDPSFQPVTNIMGTRFPASYGGANEEIKPIDTDIKQLVKAPNYDKDGIPIWRSYSYGTINPKRLNYDLERPENLNDPIDPGLDANTATYLEKVKEGKQDFAKNLGSDIGRQRIKDQWYFSTGQKFDDRDIDALINTGLNIPTSYASNISHAAEYSSPLNPGMYQGDGTIRIGPFGKSPDIMYHELFHGSGADVAGLPYWNKVMGDPIRPDKATAPKGYDGQRDQTSYLKRHGGTEGYANFQQFRQKAFDKAGLEYGDQIDMKTLQNWLNDKDLNDNDSMFYYEPEKLLEAVNTMASKEQKTPGTTKWEALSAKEMLGNIEQDNQSMNA